MPELPEVERGRRIAERVAAGRVLERVHCFSDSIVFEGVSAPHFAGSIEGRKVLRVRRWGKQIWFEMDDPPHPLFHFGMTGAFHSPGDQPLRLKAGPQEDLACWPPRFCKVHLCFDDGGQLVMTDARRFGRIRLRDDPCNEPPLVSLGFDPLLRMCDRDGFRALLRARRASVKSVLMDQRTIAGLGNWMADEVLYQAGIAPMRVAAELSATDCEAIRRAVTAVVSTAVAEDACDEDYPEDWLFHRRWGRRPDATTTRGEHVEFARVGGRTTAWVPSRQR